MPLHERAEPLFRVVAGAMAAVFASLAVLMVLVALDGSTGAGTRGGEWWAAGACAAAAAYGAAYAWKGGRWLRGLLGRAAWPTRARRE